MKAKALAVLLLGAAPASAQIGDKFVWSELRLDGGGFDPGVHSEVLRYLVDTTSVLAVPERRSLTLSDPALFASPFLLLSGRRSPPPLAPEEIGRLRDYLTSGGFLWIDDSAGAAGSQFDGWVRRSLESVLPDAKLKTLPANHVVFKTFFLLKRVGGRGIVSNSLEGIEWGGRTVLVYSRNDILGSWAKDALGNHLHPCVPGGEAQRQDARKLTLNILMYALTGNYKEDAVHQPFILQKMRSGGP